MRIQVTEETHNRVVWEVDTSLARIEIGLLVSMAVCLALLIILPSPGLLGWLAIAIVVMGAPTAAILLALTTPLREQGLVERTPEGGVVRLEQRWMFQRKPVVWESSLEDVAGFSVEQQTFAETKSRAQTLARLWVFLPPEDAEQQPRMPLTNWLEVNVVQALGKSVTHVARRPLLPFPADGF
ncbi:MAG: hypothetical protein J7M17_06610 [Anaerolineae bacterium]|nr:hypothetical protein [Anaerolineae bacterium]